MDNQEGGLAKLANHVIAKFWRVSGAGDKMAVGTDLGVKRSSRLVEPTRDAYQAVFDLRLIIWLGTRAGW